jgi:hypothetical protein
MCLCLCLCVEKVGGVGSAEVKVVTRIWVSESCCVSRCCRSGSRCLELTASPGAHEVSLAISALPLPSRSLRDIMMPLKKRSKAQSFLL